MNYLLVGLALIALSACETTQTICKTTSPAYQRLSDWHKDEFQKHKSALAGAVDQSENYVGEVGPEVRVSGEYVKFREDFEEYQKTLLVVLKGPDFSGGQDRAKAKAEWSVNARNLGDLNKSLSVSSKALRDFVREKASQAADIAAAIAVIETSHKLWGVAEESCLKAFVASQDVQESIVVIEGMELPSET